MLVVNDEKILFGTELWLVYNFFNRSLLLELTGFRFDTSKSKGVHELQQTDKVTKVAGQRT